MVIDRYKKARLVYKLFKSKIGEEVLSSEIIDCTGWAESSVKSYYTKKWAGIVLNRLDINRYLVCMDVNITEEHYIDHHSQIDDDVR